MSTDIQTTNGKEIEIWNNERADKIRKLFAPNLTSDEFHMFWGLGKSLDANPFKREIWAVKYDKSKPAQIFLGRDFYRKKAQEQPDYDGHVVDAVYENDSFQVKSGVPEHSYNLKDRGKLLGAYSVVHKSNITHPFYVYVELDEYHKGQSTWKEKPATMIKKVAEAQALRGAYQGIFRGTYDESEQWTEEYSQPEQRQTIDIDMDTEDGGDLAPPEKDPDFDVVDEEQEALLSEVNTLGKHIYGGIKDWVKESRIMVSNYDETAEGLNDLDVEGLTHIKRQLEAKQKQEA